MSGKPEELEVLAGEYVLGLLDPAEARAVEAAAAADPALRAAIAAWAQRLDPLGDTIAPVPPSQGLWARIEAGMAPQRAGAPPRPLPAPRSRGVSVWRGVAVASLLLAAGLAGFIVWSGAVRQLLAPPPAAVALLTAPGGIEAALRIQVAASGRMTVTPLVPLPATPGRRLTVWAWPKQEPAPVPLGVLPPGGRSFAFGYRVRDGTPVMVTSDPPGAGLPTSPGPTLYQGLLTVPD